MRKKKKRKKKIKRSSYSSLPNKPSHSCTSASEQLLHKHTTGLLSSHRVCSGHPHVAWIKAALKLHYRAGGAVSETHKPAVPLVNAPVLHSAPRGLTQRPEEPTHSSRMVHGRGGKKVPSDFLYFYVFTF